MDPDGKLDGRLDKSHQLAQNKLMFLSCSGQTIAGFLLASCGSLSIGVCFVRVGDVQGWHTGRAAEEKWAVRQLSGPVTKIRIGMNLPSGSVIPTAPVAITDPLLPILRVDPILPILLPQPPCCRLSAFQALRTPRNATLESPPRNRSYPPQSGHL